MNTITTTPAQDLNKLQDEVRRLLNDFTEKHNIKVTDIYLEHMKCGANKFCQDLVIKVSL